MLLKTKFIAYMKRKLRMSIREHGKCGNFPVNKIEEIKAVIDPTTAEKDI